jgi:hypothetical protein
MAWARVMVTRIKLADTTTGGGAWRIASGANVRSCSVRTSGQVVHLAGHLFRRGMRERPN